MATALGEFEQLLILAVLQLGDEAYGVTIRRAIEDATGRNLSAGAVYTALGRLETRGLIASTPGESIPERTGMRRRYYRVQPEGARQVHRTMQHLRSLSRGVMPKLEELASRSGESS